MILRPKLVLTGEEYFSHIIELIQKTESFLFFIFYTFEDDEYGEKVFRELELAKSRGVDIFILCDYIGSHKLKDKTVSGLRSKGIRLEFFNRFSLLNIFLIGRRIHSKLIISDGQRGILGGANISKDYLDQKNHWFDFCVRIGKLNSQQALALMWNELSKAFSLDRKKFFPISKDDITNISSTIVKNDWWRKINSIRRGYLREIRRAESDIFIVSSYFFPSTSLLVSLVSARKRGVKVTLALSKELDIPFYKTAMTKVYSYLLGHGIELIEYERDILHGKLILVDQKWVSIGSFNLEHTSHYGNIELNMESVDSLLIESLLLMKRSQLLPYCSSITLESSLRFSATRFITYFFYKVLVILSVSYMKTLRYLKYSFYKKSH